MSHTLNISTDVYCVFRRQETQIFSSVCITTRPSEAGLQMVEGEKPRCGFSARIWLQHEWTEG